MLLTQLCSYRLMIKWSQADFLRECSAEDSLIVLIEDFITGEDKHLQTCKRHTSLSLMQDMTTSCTQEKGPGDWLWASLGVQSYSKISKWSPPDAHASFHADHTSMLHSIPHVHLCFWPMAKPLSSEVNLDIVQNSPDDIGHQRIEHQVPEVSLCSFQLLYTSHSFEPPGIWRALYKSA